MEALLADIPTDPRAFQRWLSGQHWAALWPTELCRLAIQAGHALVDRLSPDWDADYEKRRLAKARWSAFTTAYADHVGAK